MIKNCKDCIYFMGGRTCSLHWGIEEIARLENNNCRLFVKKTEKKSDTNKEVEERTGHYKGNIEPFDVTKEMGIHKEFVKGNIIKYTIRAGKKAGQEKSDIKKILDYALELCLYSGIDKTEIENLIKDRMSYYAKTKTND